MGNEKEMSAAVSCNSDGDRQVPDRKRKPDGPPEKEYQEHKESKEQKTTVTYSLLVTVHCSGMPVPGATVSLQEDGSQGRTNDAGQVKFTKEKGPYTIQVTFPQDADYANHPPVPGNLSGDVNVQIGVQKKNIISATIKAEYDVMLLDRGLSQHQAGGEAKIQTDNVIHLQISFHQSNPAFRYSGGGRLTRSGMVDMFSDKQCVKPFDGIISNNDIVSGNHVKDCYLKSTSAGIFNCKVALDQTNDANVKLENPPVSKTMSVAEVRLHIFTNDHAALKSKKIDQDVHPIGTYYNELKSYLIPRQLVMGDKDKIEKGRFLHVQQGDNHARAKIQLKIDPAQWPAESDKYTLNLINKSGKIKIFDAETDVMEIVDPEVKIADIKQAADHEKTFWVEGATASNALHDALLGLSLDRPQEGLQHEQKANADWARFTVVKIQEVKLDYPSPGPGQANAWNDTDNRFYINLKPDPDGRKIKIKATVSPQIKGVPIHFMLAGDRDNGKAGNWGVDMPNTWQWDQINSSLKHTDRNDRKDFLHFQVETNANGVAEKELVLSRFGGDKFTPACYINEDPHLAKYIHGHPDLEKKKPALSLTAIQVWRKFWTEPIRFHRMPAVDLRDSVSKFERVKVEMEVLNAIVIYDQNVANATQLPVYYPEWMVRGGNGMQDIFIGTDYNDRNFYGISGPDNTKPLKIPMLLCQGSFGDAGPSTADGWDILIGEFPKEVQTDKVALFPCIDDPSLDLLITGDWEAYDNLNNLLDQGKLLPRDVSIQMGRRNVNCVTIAIPSNINIPPMLRAGIDRISIIDFSINGAESFAGCCFEGNALIAYDPQKPNDIHNTVAHEIGHAFNQVIEAKDTTPLGLPRHPQQTTDRGNGNHCMHKTGPDFDCIMYEATLANDPVLAYCPTCVPYINATDYSYIII